MHNIQVINVKKPQAWFHSLIGCVYGYKNKMTDRKKYKKRPKYHVTAVQFDLQSEGFNYQKWGSSQYCKPGDWLINNDDDIYTVDKDYFKEHYRKVSAGVFEKVGEIWAEPTESDGSIETIEGETNFRAGDYLVFDRRHGGIGYAISKARFERWYEPLDVEVQLTQTQRDYIEDRVVNAIQWYDKNAGRNKIYFHVGQTVAIVSAAAVPIFSGFSPGEGDWIKWSIAILGGFSAVVAGLLSLFNWQFKWIKYRSAVEDLKSHLAQFYAGLGVYHEPRTAFNLLGENCERIMSAERGRWAEQTEKIGKKEEEE